MDVTPYVTGLREDLMSAAAAGDEHTQRTAALLAAAIEPAARLAVMNALADLAAEVTEALDGERVVEVRLDGRQVRVAVSEPARSRPSEEPPAPPPAPPLGDPGDISRITLRLMEQIKNRAEQAANTQGMSLNAWISQAVQGALHGSSHDWGDWGRAEGRRRDRRDGNRGQERDDDRRLRGWVQG
jgi:uncharacterized protein (DUF1778 family)